MRLRLHATEFRAKKSLNNDDNNECEEHTGEKNRVKIIIKVILDDINTISMTRHICAQTHAKPHESPLHESVLVFASS